MKNILLPFLLSIILIHACKRKTQTAISTKPYPSLADQRAVLASLSHPASTRVLDSTRIIRDLEYLSAALCEGRKPGTAGHALALAFVTKQLRAAGADSFNNSILQTFSGKNINGTIAGTNVVGWVKGTGQPTKYIVISAHYDHLGKTASGAIFHGADDNASGVACLLAMAKYFKVNPQEYSLIFVALDREETGLEGAHAFVQQYVTEQNFDIDLNINMDMIARSDKNELYASGVFHYPSLLYVVETTRKKTTVNLLMGHDTGPASDDWTTQSDHAAFHKKSIPFLYFGVEDHPDYHKVTDTHDKINYSRYVEICNLMVEVVKTIKN